MGAPKTESGYMYGERAQRDKNAGIYGCGEAIIRKKRFVPENFLHVAMKVA